MNNIRYAPLAVRSIRSILAQDRKPTAIQKIIMDEWNEEDHPRNPDGTFGEGGGESPKMENPVAEKSKAQLSFEKTYTAADIVPIEGYKKTAKVENLNDEQKELIAKAINAEHKLNETVSEYLYQSARLYDSDWKVRAAKEDASPEFQKVHKEMEKDGHEATMTLRAANKATDKVASEYLKAIREVESEVRQGNKNTAEQRGYEENQSEWKRQWTEEKATWVNQQERDPNGVIQVKTPEDALKAMQYELGVSQREMGDMNPSLLVDNTNQMLKLNDKFGVWDKPTFHGRGSGYLCIDQQPPEHRNWIASCQGNMITFYKEWYGGENADKKLGNEEAGNCNDGWHMPCDTNNPQECRNYIVTHEYGHAVENMLTERDGKNYEKAHKQYRAEINKIAKERNPRFKEADHLSEYGQTNDEEFFAETFANSQLSRPNELGEAMNVWLERKGAIKKK